MATNHRTVDRLSGLDASFLYFETPNHHMHVAITVVLDPSTMPDGYSFDALRNLIETRLHLVPPFRRKVVDVPLRLDHPIWVEDPDFDLDRHVHRIAAPAPGSRRELAAIAADIASSPLDRSRPLWDLTVVEGLEGGEVGVVAKVHHCAVDGVSGAELMVNLFDLDPGGRSVEPPPVEAAPPLPSRLELARQAVVARVRRQATLVPLLGSTARTLNALVRRHLDPAAVVGAVPLTAPRAPFNAAVSPDRTVAFSRLSLEEMKTVKNAVGCTVNDVVLAVVGGALRRYLASRGALPEDPLIAVCPISVRADDERGEVNNRVSAMFTSLATDRDDPLERLARINEVTRGAKEDHRAIGARFLQDWAEHAAPTTFALASRLYSGLHLADRHRPIHNVIISNVPGPPFPLYCAGAKLVAAYPMGPVMEGSGLNVTVMSYLDRVDVGFIACRQLMPDVWDLPGHLEASMAELVDATSEHAAS